MTPLMVYRIECPTCFERIVVLGTNLGEIVRHPRGWRKAAAQLVLVCQHCRIPFLYEYRPFGGSGWTDAPLQELSELYPIGFALTAECDDSNCMSRVELIAFRSPDTTQQDVSKEAAGWKLEGILCPNGHQILPPKA